MKKKHKTKSKTISKMARTRTVYKKAKRYYRRGASATGGIKGKATKFLAGMALKKVLGAGLVGIGASYLIADWEGAAGALIGDSIEPMATGLLGNLTGATSGTTGKTGAKSGVLGTP